MQFSLQATTTGRKLVIVGMMPTNQLLLGGCSQDSRCQDQHSAETGPGSESEGIIKQLESSDIVFARKKDDPKVVKVISYF